MDYIVKDITVEIVHNENEKRLSAYQTAMEKK